MTGSGLRLMVATGVGNLAARASRVVGRGSGASIRGQVITRLAPRAFADLLDGRRVLVVSGTNGKTTTTHLLAAAVGEGALGRVVTNADGANLRPGIVSALSGGRGAETAVVEADERVVAGLIAEGRPEILVMLNFSRDQMDRHQEIKSLGRSWRDALLAAGPAGPVVVANASDPLVAWAASAANKVIWVETDTRWTADAAVCPQCGAVLAGVAGPRGCWNCPACGFTQPAADYGVDGWAIRLPDGSVTTPALRVPGRFNVSNAACALAAAVAAGVGVEAALRGMRTVAAPAGRFATLAFGAVTARLILAKNPAGWAEALPMAASEPLVMAIDAVAADGKDLSWLWDVEFEQLRGRTVVITGPRTQDLAVRLTYADVGHRVVPDLATALAGLAGSVDVISTYTPFQRLLKLGRPVAQAPVRTALPSPSPSPVLPLPRPRDACVSDSGEFGHMSAPARARPVEIVVVYPSLLGVYGDYGNARVLQQRLMWRGIDATLVTVEPGEPLPLTGAVYLLGGGEDAAQVTAVEHLRADGHVFDVVDRGAVVFAVCAGYQIAGRTFAVGDRDVPGLGLLDVTTRRGPVRAVGEILTRWTKPDGTESAITGFENHGGYTTLGPAATPLARVEKGVGNANDGTEGAVQGTVIGTYPHGPVLARNPELADYLLELALRRSLDPLPSPEIDELRRQRFEAIRRAHWG